jgi:hypothetical protein
VLPASAWAQAEKRIALLIGNKDYKPSLGALINPLNDTRQSWSSQVNSTASAWPSWKRRTAIRCPGRKTAFSGAIACRSMLSGKAFVVQCRQVFTSRTKGATEPGYRSETTSVRHFFEDVGCWLPIPGADSEITIELQREAPKTSGR